jgi:hypothetical protein
VIESVQTLLVENQKVLIIGELQVRGEDNELLSIIVREIKNLEDIQPVCLGFEQAPKYEDMVYLSQVLAQNSGYHPVILKFPDGSCMKTGSRFWMNARQPQIIHDLQEHFGPILNVQSYA